MSPLHLDLTDYRSIAKLEEIAAELESRDARSLEQAKP
jgi:hypothetical protein